MSVTLTLAILATLFAGPQQPKLGSDTTSPSEPRATGGPLTSFTRVYAPDTPHLVLPVIAHHPSLRYTPEALRANVQGSIDLEITVGVDGRVRDAMVVKSLDSVYGMDDSALQAVSQWVFEPARLDGKVVSARTKVTMTATLR